MLSYKNVLEVDREDLGPLPAVVSSSSESGDTEAVADGDT